MSFQDSNSILSPAVLRRNILSFLLVGVFIFSGNSHAQDRSKNKPNIVLIIADDLGFQDIAPYGSTQVLTPHLQQLADDGMSFDNMFTSTAMCSPTRQQILTGLYPVRNGAYPNHSHVYEGTKSVAHYMQNAGYETAIIGKRDFGNAESFPFEFLGGRNWDNGKGKDIDLAKAKKYIDEAKKPYFLVIASNQPHVPWVRGNAEAYPPKNIKVPGYLVDTKQTREALSKYYAEITYLDSLVGQCIDMVRHSPQGDNTILIFTSEHGPQFPFAKWTCYDQGLKTSFIVKWPGHIKSGSRTAALTQYVDVVPTLLDLTGADLSGIETGTKDIYGKTGFDGKSFKDVLLKGKDSIREYVYGVQTTRGIINGSDNYPVRSVRDKEYLYIHNLNPSATFTNVQTKKGVVLSWSKKDKDRAEDYSHRPEKELYNIQADPYQLKNLASLPKYQIVMDKMEAELRAFMKQQGDEGKKTEADADSRQSKNL